MYFHSETLINLKSKAF